MSAKDSLLTTLTILGDCLTDSAVIDKAPSEVAHNLRASMLRQGLAVLTFSAIEAFIRGRTGEVLQSFTNSLLTFGELHPSLQRASTIGALDGVKFRLKMQSQPDKVTWLMAALEPIANATRDITNLSYHSFGYAASNLAEDDIRDILKAFGVASPWAQMTSLTRRIGIALLDCQSDFVAIKLRRHSSAHNTAGSVPYTDLLDSLRSALAICVTFDILISNARGLINLRIGPGVAQRPAMLSAHVSLIFVEQRMSTNKFIVRKEQMPPPAASLYRPTLRIFGDEGTASSFGERHVHRHRSNMVVLSAASTPTNWVTW